MKTLAELLAARAVKVDAYSAHAESMIKALDTDAEIEKDADDKAKAEIKTRQDADKKKAADLLKDIGDLDAAIEAKKKADELKASIAKPIREPGKSDIILPSAYRTGRLKTFKGEGADKRALGFGHFVLASVYGSAKSQKWCAENGIDIKAHAEGVNTTGGVFVPEEFSQDIIDLRDTYGVFRRLCQVVPMGRDTITIPRRTGGLTAYAVGEASAITASDTAWDNVRLTAQKWGVLTLMSSELDEDAVINFGDMLAGEIAYAFAVAEDTAGFSGDGSATYHGIRGILTKFTDGLGSGSNPLAGAVDAASGHDTFAEIDSTDINTLMSKLPQYAYLRGRPAFFASQVAWTLVFQRLTLGAGGLTKDDITGAIQYRYLGYPVEIIPAMPTSTGDLSDLPMLLFGDIAMAVAFGDRRGMTLARSTEYKFAEDQVALKATERFDINVHDIGSSTVAGPLVALMGE